jgi:hypothetical protein
MLETFRALCWAYRSNSNCTSDMPTGGKNKIVHKFGRQSNTRCLAGMVPGGPVGGLIAASPY